MPYASNDELPDAVRRRYSDRCQTVFREAFNGHDGDEASKFKVAHTAARKCMDSTMKAEGTIGGTPISKLPDSAFADPKNRRYPHHDASGKVDRAHLANAMARCNQDATSCSPAIHAHLMAHENAMGMGKAEFLKAEQINASKWRVLAIPYGGPFAGKDFDGEYFSERTDIKPDWFDRRPLVWHHNLDRTMKADPVLGTADDLEQADDGWWTTLWLDRSHRYWAEVDKLLQSGKVYGSSGSLPNFVRTDAKTGEILVWPYIEQTLTPTPSNIFSVVVPSKAVDHFSEAQIGLSPAFLKAAFSELDGHEADLPTDLDESADESGDAAAIQRLTGEIAHLEELLTRLRR